MISPRFPLLIFRVESSRSTVTSVAATATPSKPCAEIVLLTISGVGSIVFVAWVLWVFHFGFDLTDEGFYLNWISAPFNYSASSSQFGFIYHPLYLLVGGNVALLRQANFLISFGLAWLLAWHVLGLLAERAGSTLTAQVRVVASAGLATSAVLSVVFAGLWLPTPSYNTLTYQGLLLAATGLVLARPDRGREGLAGWLMLAMGGWLSFMGKPTSAAVLAVLVGTYLVLSLRLRLVPLLLSLATVIVLLGLSAVMIDGSVDQFVNRFVEGLRIGQSLGGGHSFEKMFRLEDLWLPEKQKNLLIGLFVSVAIAVAVAAVHWARWPQAASVAALILSLLGLHLTIQVDWSFALPGSRRGLSVYAIPAGIALAALLVGRLKNLQSIGWANALLIPVLILFSYAYTFGSSNDYWIPIASAAIFVFVAAYIFFLPLAGHPRLNAMLLVGVVGVQVLTALIAYFGTLTPYRQPNPLAQNRVAVTIGHGKSSLILSDSHSTYLASGERLLSQSGFMPGTPMIDLTGHSPGFLYAVGADSVGLAWTLGGYPGSDNLVIQSLATVPCEQLASAWILTEPSGPRPISATVLESFGANIERDFRMVGELLSPEGQRQIIHAPQREQAKGAGECALKRARP